MKKILQGVIPPVATPFKNEELDLDSYQANIKSWNATGLAGYLVVGSNGEAVFLDDNERDQVVSVTVEVAAPEKIIMVGVGAESTRTTISQAKRAAELGADCLLVITPAYFKSQMTPERLEGHFRKVADAATVQVLAYNFPQATGVNLTPDLVARLAEHGNIAGIKDSSGNIAQLSEIIHQTDDDFAVFVGNAEVCFPAMCLGAAGAILAVSNVLPEKCVELVNLVRAGDLAQARELQWELARLAALVTRIHGVGGLKAAMAIVGYQPGTVRSPLTMPGQAAIDEIAAELKKFGW